MGRLDQYTGKERGQATFPPPITTQTGNQNPASTKKNAKKNNKLVKTKEGEGKKKSLPIRMLRSLGKAVGILSHTNASPKTQLASQASNSIENDATQRITAGENKAHVKFEQPHHQNKFNPAIPLKIQTLPLQDNKNAVIKDTPHPQKTLRATPPNSSAAHAATSHILLPPHHSASIEEILKTALNNFIKQLEEDAQLNRPILSSRPKIDLTVAYNAINFLSNEQTKKNQHAEHDIDTYTISTNIFNYLVSKNKRAIVKEATLTNIEDLKKKEDAVKKIATLVKLYNELVRRKAELFKGESHTSSTSHPLLRIIVSLLIFLDETTDGKKIIPLEIIQDEHALPKEEADYFILNRQSENPEYHDINLIIKALTPKDLNGNYTISDKTRKEEINKIIESSLSENRRKIVFNMLDQALANYPSAKETLALNAPMDTPKEAMQIRMLKTQTLCLTNGRSPVSNWQLPRSRSTLQFNTSRGFLKKIGASLYQFLYHSGQFFFNKICFFLPGNSAKVARAKYATRALVNAYINSELSEKKFKDSDLRAGQKFLQLYQQAQPAPSTQTYKKGLDALYAQISKEIDKQFAHLSDEQLNRAEEKRAGIRDYFEKVIEEYFSYTEGVEFKSPLPLKTSPNEAQTYKNQLVPFFEEAYKNGGRTESMRRAGADIGYLISSLLANKQFLNLFNNTNLPSDLALHFEDPLAHSIQNLPNPIKIQIQKLLHLIPIETANGITSRDLLFRPMDGEHSPEKETQALIQAGMPYLSFTQRKRLEKLFKEDQLAKLITVVHWRAETAPFALME